MLNQKTMRDEEREVEPLVVELTRKIHPEDLGTPTSNLEEILRDGLMRAYKLNDK